MTIILTYNDTRLSLPRGTILLNGAFEAGLFPHAPCGGKGICGKCLVEIADSAGRRKVISCTHKLNEDTVLFAAIEEEQPTGTAPADIISFAADIGTTTVKISALSQSGERFEVTSFPNPQRIFGADVISRIAASTHHAAMRHVIRLAVAGALHRFCDQNAIDTSTIQALHVTGNTAMLALFTGISVSSMGAFPYRAPIDELDATDQIFSEFSENCALRILPSVSAFLGADFLGGLYQAIQLSGEGFFLYCDVGTNGEMAIVKDGSVFASSVPVGPAIEGVGLSMGMTAEEGAVIHAFGTFPRISYELYSGNRPLGFAGSGIVDVIALLRKHGAILESGQINPAFAAGEEESPKQLPLPGGLSLMQSDIRQFQLAKGGILSCAKILERKSGISLSGVPVLLTGSFGENLSAEAFRSLGFFPETIGEIRAMKNLALADAEDEARGRSRSELALLRGRIVTLELAMQESFAEIFPTSLNL